MSDWTLQFSNIVLGAREWAGVAAALAASIVLLAIWSYAHRQATKSQLVALVLKMLAALALGFCLLQPMLRTERPLPGANLMAIVVDNSRSMEMRAPGSDLSRIERLRSTLVSDAPWQSRLAQDFEVRKYAFDSRVYAIQDFEELDFAGNHSAISETLRSLETRFAARPVAGMLLFTDGLCTDDLQALSQLRASFPIYPVTDSTQAKLVDLSLDNTSVSVSSFELAPASIETTLRARHLEGKNATVRLMDEQGKTIASQVIACDSDDFEERVRFQFQPLEPGTRFVTVRALLVEEDSEQLPMPTSSIEVTTANNAHIVTVDRSGGPFRILYVAGRPNWEFKFLRRALEEDVEVSLRGLVRIAKKEPKFSFRDRVVDSTNPLMAGFAEGDDSAEQYDEPVLLPIGVEDSEELKSGFPSSAEALFNYHAVILDDVEASFFTQQQMLLLRRFVAERGGGFMMLGGQESFNPMDYDETPLSDLLPVYLKRSSRDDLDKNLPVRFQLTREGRLEPWTRLRANESDEAQRVELMPDFHTWNPIIGVKPGASVLAELSTGEKVLPGLVSQRFGRGRTLALLLGDFWQWSLRRSEKETDDLAQCWRQLSHWLTNDTPKRIEANIERPTSSTDPFRIAITLRTGEFKPLDNADVKVTIVEPNGQSVVVGATPVAERFGEYFVEYWSQQDGGYRCTVSASSSDGEQLEDLRTGWTAQPSAAEFSRVEPDTELLRQIAKNSNGEVVPLENLESFVSGLPTSKIPITEIRLEPIWHRPWLLTLALFCLCAEWGLRRWKGLP